MNKKISTRIGILTALAIQCYLIAIQRFISNAHPNLILFQFLFLFVGLFASGLLLFRHYADIKFIDAFTHHIKTLSVIIVLMVICNSILFLIFNKNEPTQNLTFIMMKTIFSFALSGLLSSLFSSFLLITFTKK